MFKHVSLAAVLAMATVPAFAQTVADDAKKLDPNRKICEKVEITGSRLRAQKVCMTAAEWEAKRQRDREELEDTQRKTDGPRSG